ncbi:UNVERIFIED_CONTAM: hypothetical protein Q9R58_17650 [Methylobacteriaceae bacterium AG10]|nr:hypothetical protein [Methylobacteriaceae bacterium AG10]
MDRPIIFSAPMIRAIRREIAAPGTGKTQTRRILKPQPDPLAPVGYIHSYQGSRTFDLHTRPRFTNGRFIGSDRMQIVVAPCATGDRLWVKENHYRTDDGDEEFAIYACDEEAVREHLAEIDALPATISDEVKRRHRKLRPSIHMPRWASRLTLLVTDVRVERLNAISEADAIAEGMPDFGSFCESLDPGELNAAGETASETASRLRWPQRWFASLWNDINGADAWDANPWVVAITFQPFETNIDRMPERPAPVALSAAAE